MSLRGKRVFRLTWQSRGSTHIYKGAFQQIPTSRNLTSTTMVDCNSKSKSITILLAIIAPLDDIVFTFLTLDLLQMHFVLSKPILIQSRLIKSFDHEGWAVGEAVSANRQYTANKSVGHACQYLVVFFKLYFLRKTLISATQRKTLVVSFTYVWLWK